MKNTIPALVLSLLAAVFAAAQTKTPTPAPTPPDDGDVVKISTALVQVDVTVTDRRGKIVTDLRRDEIEIYENGKKQDSSSFNFVSNVRETVERPRDNKGQTVPLPPSTVRPEQVRRTIALVVDDLTLSFQSTYYVRRALKKFVDEQMMDGDLVAIIRTGAGVGALQQFTTDRRQLYAAIENVKWNPSGSGGIGAFEPLRERPEESPRDEGAGDGIRTAEGIEREFSDFRKSVFATGTLGAINYVVRGMADLPGRKSIMLLSDGFRLFTTDAGGTPEATRVLDALRRLVDRANRAAVVVYTMDARGLQYTGITAADDVGSRSAQQIAEAESARRDELLETQDGLRYLAKETGGFAIVNNNDLSGGIRRILDDQSYYLVGYEPDEATFDPRVRRYNRLQVRVTRPGTQVRYRSGFFGIADKAETQPAMTGEQKLVHALTSPFALNDIQLRLNALFANIPFQGPVIRSFLHIDAKGLTFTDEPDGSKKANFDVVAVGYGDSGVPVEQLAKSFTMNIKKEQFATAMEKGFVYDVLFPMKKAGAYQLRVAIRDHATGKVGSANQFVEVPNLKKKRLTLSGVVLENLPPDIWERRNKGEADTRPSTALNDTSLRRFRQGTVLNYGFTIYNAKTATGQPPDLTAQMRVFRDGKQIFEGAQQPVQVNPQKDPAAVSYMGTLSLATKMEPGEYVLQIAVTDRRADEKRRTVYQFVQFEVVE